MIYIGIDPGLTGALAAIREGDEPQIFDLPTMARGKGSGVVKSQLDPYALAVIVRAVTIPSPINRHESAIAVLEQVSAMPSQGVATMFSLGDTFGCIRAVLACEEIRVELITPSEWKNHFAIRGPKNIEDKAKRTAAAKDLARSHATVRYPSLADKLSRIKDHGRAEALLIATYGMESFK